MAKKIWYSEPLAYIWDCYNEACKTHPMSPKEYIYTTLNNEMNSFSSSKEEVQNRIYVDEMFFADSNRELLHLYFVDNNLRDFLIDLPINDFKGLTDYIIEHGIKSKAGIITNIGGNYDTDEEVSNFFFGIHIPYDNRMRGYAFRFCYNSKDKNLLFNWVTETYSGNFNMSQYESMINDKSGEYDFTLSMFRLAVNTIAYMSVFPDCVVDGVPDEVKGDYYKTVRIAEKVLENITSDLPKKTRPHFRRGYFKRLTSDFYTKKKGQIIFVNQTMVNGTAKTVYTAENLEEFEK